MTSHLRLRRAFTLIELVMVLTIIGIIVTFAIPRIDVSGSRATSAAQVLGTTILTAQRQAVTQQHDIVVRFDTAGNNIKIHQDRDNDATVDANEHVRSVSLGEGNTFGLGAAPQFGSYATMVTFTRTNAGQQILVFHRDGSASQNGAFYFTSTRAAQGADRPTDTRVVVVERATGRASWHAYRASGWAKVF